MLSHRPGMARADINATYAVLRWVVLEIEELEGAVSFKPVCRLWRTSSIPDLQLQYSRFIRVYPTHI